ncbi:helix-turn-helix domain-containing protein [Nonomuraea sp. NPDC049129]|uniref:ATP-binding protein n=1 Tax=unclassified Nonomuraea TaxID=2593643 RepID=UPI0033CC0A08
MYEEPRNGASVSPAGEEPSLGVLIRTWREQALLTQEELAKRSGLNPRTLRRLEHGEPHRPRGSSLLALAEALGLDPRKHKQLVAASLRSHTHPRARGFKDDTDAPAPAMTMPRQLPPGPAHFVGRSKELRTLDGMLTTDEQIMRTGPKVVVIAGCAGIGKTALAVHWAHLVADRFHDGQLYVNLRGFAPSAEPADPAEAIRSFLGALGVVPQQIPAGADAQAALWRSVVNGMRLLIVVDNALDAGQVRPLLPGGSGCLVIVTSRNQLPGLVAAGASPLVLEPLSNGDSLRLLAERLGAARVVAAQKAAKEIAAGCAGLPLALSVVAARASIHPDFSLDDLAVEADAASSWLDVLSCEDPFADVRSAFSWSYRTLGAAAARMFRLLGMHPAPDIGVPAAASMCGLPVRQARALLAELHRAHLIAESVPGRYQLHDLMRAYAVELAAAQESRTERHQAERRIFDHYLLTSLAASHQLTGLPHDSIPVDPLALNVRPESIATYQQAMEWYQREHRTLLALVDHARDNGDDCRLDRLARGLADYLDRGRHWQEWRLVEHGHRATST